MWCPAYSFLIAGYYCILDVNETTKSLFSFPFSFCCRLGVCLLLRQRDLFVSGKLNHETNNVPQTIVAKGSQGDKLCPLEGAVSQGYHRAWRGNGPCRPCSPRSFRFLSVSISYWIINNEIKSGCIKLCL